MTGGGVYDAMGAAYATENDTSPWNALYERPATLALLGDVAGRRVLDAGCGAGPLAAALMERGARVDGFDESPVLIELARARALPDASFTVGDLSEPLPWPDETFDLAACSLVLHYLRDWEAPLRELRRVVKPGGALVLSTHHPAMDAKLSATGRLLEVEPVIDRWTKGGRDYEVTFYRRPLSAMFAAFTAAGWTVERVEEPLPLDACREQAPDVWEKLTTRPWFLFVRLTR